MITKIFAGLPTLDARLFAHVFADGFGEGTGFEGAQFHQTIGYLFSIFQRDVAPSAIHQKLTSQLEYTYEIAKALSEIYESREEPAKCKEMQKALAQTISEKFASLADGESVIIPGGWSELGGGHAILYEVIRSGETYTVRVFNTGDGIQHHHSKTEGKKEKYYTSFEVTEISRENMTNLGVARYIVELKSEVFFDPSAKKKDYTPVYDKESVYDGLISALGGKVRENEWFDDRAYMSPQRSGFCAWKVLMAMLRRESSSRSEYLTMRAKIREAVVADLEKMVEESGKVDFLVEKGLKKWALSLVKVMKESGEDSIDIDRLIDTIETRIAKKVDRPEQRELKGGDGVLEPIEIPQTRKQTHFVYDGSIADAQPLRLEAEPPLFTTGANVKEVITKWAGYVDGLTHTDSYCYYKAVTFLERAIASLPVPMWGEETCAFSLPEQEKEAVLNQLELFLGFLTTPGNSSMTPHRSVVPMYHLLALIDSFVRKDPTCLAPKNRLFAGKLKEFKERAFSSLSDHYVGNQDYFDTIYAYFEPDTTPTKETLLSLRSNETDRLNWNPYRFLSFPKWNQLLPADHAYFKQCLSSARDVEGESDDDKLEKLLIDFDGNYLSQCDARLLRCAAIVSISPCFMQDQKGRNKSRIAETTRFRPSTTSSSDLRTDRAVLSDAVKSIAKRRGAGFQGQTPHNVFMASLRSFNGGGENHVDDIENNLFGSVKQHPRGNTFYRMFSQEFTQIEASEKIYREHDRGTAMNNEQMLVFAGEDRVDLLFRALSYFSKHPDLLKNHEEDLFTLFDCFFKGNTFSSAVDLSPLLEDRVVAFFETTYSYHKSLGDGETMLYILEFVDRLALAREAAGKTSRIREAIDVEKCLNEIKPFCKNGLLAVFHQYRFSMKYRRLVIANEPLEQAGYFEFLRSHLIATMWMNAHFSEHLPPISTQMRMDDGVFIMDRFLTNDLIVYLETNRDERAKLLREFFPECTEAWEGSFPNYSSGEVSVNILTGKVQRSGQNYFNFQKLCHSMNVDFHHLTKEVEGDSTYHYTPDRTFRFVSKDYSCSMEKMYEGEWHTLQDEKSARDAIGVVDKKCIIDKAKYYSNDRRILVVVNHEVRFAIEKNRDGKVVAAPRLIQDEKFLPVEQGTIDAQSHFITDVCHAQMASFWRSQEHNGKWFVELPNAKLSFFIEGTNVQCLQYPGYEVEANTALFPDYKLAFILKDSSGARQLVVPYISDDPITIGSGLFPIVGGVKGREAIALDTRGRPVMKTSDEALTLARIAFYVRDYEQAHDFLMRGTELNTLSRWGQLNIAVMQMLGDTSSDGLTFRLRLFAIQERLSRFERSGCPEIDKQECGKIHVLYTQYLERKHYATLPELSHYELSLLKEYIDIQEVPQQEQSEEFPLSSLPAPNSLNYQMTRYRYDDVDRILGTKNLFQFNFLKHYTCAKNGTADEKAAFLRKLLLMRGEQNRENKALAALLEQVIARPNDFPAPIESLDNDSEIEKFIGDVYAASRALPPSTKEADFPLAKYEAPPIKARAHRPICGRFKQDEGVTEEAIIDLAHKIPLLDSMSVKEIRLRRLAGVEKMMGIKEAMALYAMGDYEAYKLWTRLSDEEIETLDTMIGSYLLTKRGNGDRHYDLTDRNRPLLVFEAMTGMTLRADQLKNVLMLFESEEPNQVLHMIMGAGKSHVLAPLWLLMKGKEGKLPLLVVPDALFETGKELAMQKSHEAFGQFGHTPTFERSEKFTPKRLETVLASLEEWKRRGEYLYMTRESLLCFTLKVRELLGNHTAQQSHQGGSDYKKMCDDACAIMRFFRDETDALMDEVHLSMECRDLMNFTFGNRGQVESKEAAIVTDVVLLLARDRALKDIVSLATNDQGKMGPDVYEREVQPRVIAHFVEAFQMGAHQEEFENYLADRVAEVPDFVANSARKNEIAVAKVVLSILESTLKRNRDEHYGIGASALYAIPFIASNVPNEKAQFALWVETVLYSSFAYLQQGVPVKLLKQYVDHLKEAAKQEMTLYNIPQSETTVDKKFRKFFGKDLFNFLDYNKLAQQMMGNYDAIIDFVHEIVIPEIALYPSRFEGNAQTLFSMFNTVCGMTGTPWNHETYPSSVVTNEDPAVDAKSEKLFLEKVKEVRETESSEPKEVLAEMVDMVKSDATTRAVIDVGGLFKGITNETVAKKLLDEGFQENVLGIRFYGSDNELYVYTREKKIILASQCKIATDALAMYYDQRHTFGSDAKHASDAKAIVTFSETTMKFNLYQGIWRLRGLENGQQIACLTPKRVARLISDPPLDAEKVLEFVKENQRKKITADNLYARKQEIRGIVEKHVFNKLINLEHEARVEMWKEMEEIFLRPLDSSSFEKFGGVYTEIDAKTSLQNFIDRWLVWAESKNLDKAGIEEEIRALKDVELPELDRTPQFDEGVSVEVKTQEQQNVEIEENTEAQQGNDYSTLPYQHDMKWPEATSIADTSPWWQTACYYTPSLIDRFIIPILHIAMKPFYLFHTHDPAALELDYSAPPRVLRALDEKVQSLVAWFFKPKPPQVYAANEIMAHDGHPQVFDDTFFVSNNFVRVAPKRYWETGMQKAFSKYARPVFHLLVEKNGDHYKSMLIEHSDAAFFRQKMRDEPDGKVFLYDPQVGGIEQMPANLAVTEKDLLDSDEFMRHRVMAKFWGGGLTYTQRESEILQRWIVEKGIVEMKKFFIDEIIANRPHIAKEYRKSLLSQIFNKLELETTNDQG